jgi:hypothetical protein
MLIYKNVLHTDWDRLTRNRGRAREGDDETFLYCFCCDGKGIGNEIREMKLNLFLIIEGYTRAVIFNIPKIANEPTEK